VIKKFNSSDLAHELLKQVLDNHRSALGPEEHEIDQDEQIDLPWADQSFSTLEADPPWSYEDNGFNGFQSVQEYRIHCPYRTMRFRNIVAAGAEIKRVMKPDAHCYLWTTKDFLLEAIVCMKAWGFTFKNMIVWLKTSRAGNLTYGMGHWYRNGWEAMLFGVRGKPGRPAEATSQPNWFTAPKPPAFVVPNGEGGWTKHSRKPQEAYDLICRNSPGPRLSMFQRGTRDGFYCWGDEAEEGLSKEWEGEIVSYDDTLCFGIDQDAGDVGMTFKREEIDEIRTALMFVMDNCESELPESFSAISERFDQVAEVLDGIETVDKNYLNSGSKGLVVEPDQDELDEELQADLVEELQPVDTGKVSAEEMARYKAGLSPAAYQEAVEKGWIIEDEQEEA